MAICRQDFCILSHTGVNAALSAGKYAAVIVLSFNFRPSFGKSIQESESENMKHHLLTALLLVVGTTGLRAQDTPDSCSIESIEALTQEEAQKELLRQIDSLNLVLHDPEIQPLPGQLSYAVFSELFKNTDFIRFYNDKESAVPALFDNPTAKTPRLCGDMIILTFDEQSCSFQLNLATGVREIMEASDPNSWCVEYSIIYYFNFVNGAVRLQRIVEAG